MFVYFIASACKSGQIMNGENGWNEVQTCK